jgi:catechol 2,3-dioxygenase-like lactoylglutathione lyase family enzyme
LLERRRLLRTESDSDARYFRGVQTRRNAMSDISFILLYVESPAKSEAFYTELFGRPATESSPTFVMFAMRSGLMLGLWKRHGVEPAATIPGGGEIAFTVESAIDVDAQHAHWREQGVRIAQAPTAMDFG